MTKKGAHARTHSLAHLHKNTWKYCSGIYTQGLYRASYKRLVTPSHCPGVSVPKDTGWSAPHTEWITGTKQRSMVKKKNQTKKKSHRCDVYNALLESDSRWHEYATWWLHVTETRWPSLFSCLHIYDILIGESPMLAQIRFSSLALDGTRNCKVREIEVTTPGD